MALIPKPPDSVLNKKGESERLLRAMQLQENKAEYLRIATIHWYSPRVGLDYNLKLAQQPVAALGKLFRLARKRHPVLERFQNDWATAQLVRQFLQNKRKQENKKRKEAGNPNDHRQKKRARFDVDEDEDDQTFKRRTGRQKKPVTLLTSIPEYPALVAAARPAFGSELEINFANFADTKALDAPITEFVTFTLKEGKTMAELELLIQELHQKLAGTPKFYGDSWAVNIDKPNVYHGIVGWETIEAHWAAAGEGPLKEVIDRVKELVDLWLVHAALQPFSGSTLRGPGAASLIFTIDHQRFPFSVFSFSKSRDAVEFLRPEHPPHVTVPIQTQQDPNDQTTPAKDRKSALEEYIYDTRGKLDDRYAPFVQPAEKTKLLAMLQEGEDWLYSEEGENATKSAYFGKLDALKAVGDPMVARYREAEERPRAIAELRTTLNEYMSEATSSDEKFDDRYAPYVQPAEKTMLQEVEDWLYSEEREDATKSAYVGKLDALKAVGDPIVAQYREAEERPRAIAELRTTLKINIKKRRTCIKKGTPESKKALPRQERHTHNEMLYWHQKYHTRIENGTPALRTAHPH
ncbi:hypothetical protein BU15DRAFT_76070 [Melanogaster broomeanus]|nr:hypothetical protein BU15DRAFT_76070 [Melanogaster broomeanus]